MNFWQTKIDVLLFKLVNKAQEGTIDEKDNNTKEKLNIYQQAENLSLAISASKSIGLNCIGINYDNFIHGTNYIMALGLLWQIVKLIVLQKIQLKNHPELILLSNEGEQLSNLLKLSLEKLLLRWFNFHLNAPGYNKKIQIFSWDIKYSEKYIFIFSSIKSKSCLANTLGPSIT